MYLKLSIFLLIIQHFTDPHVTAQIVHFSFKDVLSTEYRCDCLFISFKQSFRNSTELSTPHLPNKTDDDVVSIKIKHGSIFQEFPSMICDKFKNLKFIFMSRVLIGLISERTFEKCTNLEQLIFYVVYGDDVNEKIFKNNAKLSSVKVMSASLKTISKNVFAAVNQTLIDLNLHIISDSFKFPPEFANSLIKLRTLELQIRNLVELPQNFFENLENLENLQLINCNIQDLPRSIFKPLKNLQTLDLSTNKLTTIHADSFGSHPHLMVADFSGNHIVSFDPEFYQFPSLLYVSCTACDGSNLFDDNLDVRSIRNHSNSCTKNYKPR